MEKHYTTYTRAKFWLGLQDDYDIQEEVETKERELNQIKQLENKNVA